LCLPASAVGGVADRCQFIIRRLKRSSVTPSAANSNSRIGPASTVITAISMPMLATPITIGMLLLVMMTMMMPTTVSGR
jgi:hypothetical protein